MEKDINNTESKIIDLKQKQSDISSWGDYDTIVKDWGSIDKYFDGDDDETLTVKKQFLSYQEKLKNCRRKI